MLDPYNKFCILATIIMACVGATLYFILQKSKRSDKDKDKDWFESLIEYFRNHRRFVYVNKLNSNDTNIRVMSYNILANNPSGIESDDLISNNEHTNYQYAMSTDHNYCPRQYRKFEYRIQGIMAQIIAYSPDIVCIQESTLYSFNNYLKLKFDELNYNGWHVIRDINKPNGSHTHCIFWNKDKFKCLHKNIIRLNEEIADSHQSIKYIGSIKKDNDLFSKYKSRPAIAQILHLENIADKKEFIICSSHFFWDPNWSDVKLIQCMIFNVNLYNLLTNEWKLDINKIGIMFGVDANSIWLKKKEDIYDKHINDKENGLYSGIYQLMIKGFVSKIHVHHPSKKLFSRNYQKGFWEYNNNNNNNNDNELEKQLNFVKNIDDFSNNDYGKLLWKSAYNINGNEPIYTTKTAKFRATIDYIFYNDKVERLSYLELPFTNNLHKKEVNAKSDLECSQKIETFPNKFYPSDHIALCSDFKLLY